MEKTCETCKRPWVSPWRFVVMQAKNGGIVVVAGVGLWGLGVDPVESARVVIGGYACLAITTALAALAVGFAIRVKVEAEETK